MNAEQIEQLFTYHSPTPETITYYTNIRNRAKEFANYINQVCPESREKSLALTHIQQAVMWANASIAIHITPEKE